MELDPATAAYQKYGYNDRPVEARLGPHRLRIPANYFRDQIGPDFQGNFSLLVQWPDLEPLPPGQRSGQDMETFAKQITISPHYVDRVPVETRLEASAAPVAEPGTLEYEDPRQRLDLMLPQPEHNGLIPHVVDAQRLADYGRRYQAQYGVAINPNPEAYQDWFVRRDAGGHLFTLIKCDPKVLPDGFVIAGDQVIRNGPRAAGCTHTFVIPGDKLRVEIDYARVFLKDWRRIEDRARDLLQRYRAE